MRNRKHGLMIGGGAFRVATAFVLAFAGAGLARADESREQQLEQRVRELEKQLTQVKDELRGGYFTANSDLEARVADLERIAGDDNSMSSAFKAGLKTSSADGAFSYQWKGRAQYDAVWYWNGGNDDIRGAGLDEQNAEFGFRRVYLGVDGTYYGNVNWAVNLDFTGGAVNYREVYMEVANCAFGAIRVGHMKEPFGLDTLTSDLFTTFLERNAVHNSFSPNYNSGLMFHGRVMDDQLLYQAGVFRNSNGAGDDLNNAKDGEYNFTGRISMRPLVEDDGATFLHLGLSGSLRDFDGTGGVPNPGDPVALNTVAPIPFATNLGGAGFAADDGWQFGLEAAYVAGPMTFKGEYARFHGDVEGGDGATFGAWSLEAGYWLTGETQGYNSKDGTFARPTVKHNYGDGDGSGAWQLAIRYDAADLDDGDVAGEEIDSWTLGVNWWLNPNTRVALNWVRSDYDNLDETVDALALRFQWDF